MWGSKRWHHWLDGGAFVCLLAVFVLTILAPPDGIRACAFAALYLLVLVSAVAPPLLRRRWDKIERNLNAERERLLREWFGKDVH